MSLQIKFPFGKSTGPLHTCSACGFNTRHRSLFEQHIATHQENSKNLSESESEETPTLETPGSDTDLDGSGSSSGDAKPALVNRNYRCKICNFTTNKSRLILYHERDVHGIKVLVFPCDLCDYASRYKCKVQRHRKLRHKDDTEVDIQPEQEDLVTNSSTEAMEIEPEAPDVGAIYVKQPAKNVLKPTSPVKVLTNTVPSNQNDMESSDSGEGFAASSHYGALDQGTIIKSSSPTPESSHTPKHNENAFHYINKVVDSPEPMFQCALCTYCNGQKWKVANHIRSFHMKKKLFKCPYCPFVTGRKIEFCIHKTKHSDKKVYECQECTYRTTMRTNFDRHVANHQGTGPVKCTMCSYSSTGEAAVQRHMQEYHPKSDGVSPVILPSANNENSTESVVIKQEYKTPPSSPRSTSSEGINCSICGMFCRTESKLRIHMVAHSTESSHGCPLCSLKYKRLSDLNRHMKRKHNTRLKDFYAGTLLQNEPLNLSVKSEYLFQNFNNNNEDDKPLDLSMKATTNVQPVENLKCSLCSYHAKWPSDLRRHLLVHSVEKRFKCMYCHRRYKYQFDLNMHIRRMHKMPAGRSKGIPGAKPVNVTVTQVEQSENKSEVQPPSHKRKQLMPMKRTTIRQKLLAQTSHPDFRCKYCPYVGKCRSEIERHQRVHTGEKPYACLFCSYRSPWKGDMKRHIQKHHALQIENNADINTIMEKTYQPESGKPSPNAPLKVVTPHKDRMTADDEEYRAQLYKIPQASNSSSSPEGPASNDGGGMKLPVAVTPDKDPSKDDKTRNFCPYCPFICEAPSKLKCHMEIHENLKRFKCAHCGKRSNWTWDVRKHIKKDHPNMELDVITLSEEEARITLEDYLKTHAKSPMKTGPIGKRGSMHVPVSMVEMRTPLTSTPPSLINLFSQQEEDNSGAESNPESIYSMADALSLSPVDAGNIPQSSNTDRSKPFQCSTCGKRSNWKWDVKKHIQNVHKGKGKLVFLSPEEVASLSDSCISNTSPSILDLKRELNSRSKPSHHQVDLKSLKKFKCSLCPYRSNFRSDIGRHAKRLHMKMAYKVMVLSDEEAAASLIEYRETWARKKFVYSPEKEKAMRQREEIKDMNASKESDMEVLPQVKTEKDDVLESDEQSDEKSDELPDSLVQDSLELSSIQSSDQVEEKENKHEPEPQVAASKERLWKCRLCSFEDRNKIAALKHLERKHITQKPFKCKLCSESMAYRNSMYRHIRTVHNSLNYLEYVEEMVYYDDSRRSGSGNANIHYRCKLCGQTSKVRWGIIRHGRETHKKLNPKRLMSIVQKVEPVIPNPFSAPVLEIDSKKQEDSKKIKCDLCPFKTNKTGLLKIHKSYHKPQPQNKFKCKYCPYFVCAKRLLHQHYRLHAAAGDGNVKTETSPSKKSPMKINTASGKRFMCDQCPYMCWNKNDYLYHKQFHRMKPTAEFKCSLCNYWVGQPRLLRQHERVHTVEYMKKYGRNPDAPQTKLLSRVETSDVEVSPTKSDISDYLSDDALEIAQIKQQIISSKITSVPVTPEKFSEMEEEADSPTKAFQEPSDPLLMKGFLINRKGYLMKSGSMRKAHKCQYCPYTNIRATNLRLHEQMHGPRKGKDLIKCPYCNYYCGNKGLLTHHVKVHSLQYRPGLDEINDVEHEDEDKSETEAANAEEASENGDNSAKKENESPAITPVKASVMDSTKADCGVKLDACDLPKNTEYYVKYNDETGEHILERARVKKWCCEKCPYASMKKSQFERHILLHGSKQKYTCEFCDYSVPAYHLLLQHKKLHLMPNPNLLSVQSITNLQKLPEVPADVAAASNFPASKDDPVSQLGVHDHMDLYENTVDFMEPKKLYRCDRCPYTNVRRDHLLTHLKFHMVRSEMACPYCDYSVSKHHLLVQHIKVHFASPGEEGGVYTSKAVDAKELPAPETNGESTPTQNEGTGASADAISEQAAPVLDNNQPEYIDISELGNIKVVPLNNNIGDEPSKKVEKRQQKVEGEKREGTDSCKENGPMWVCQYCDRSFGASEKLLRHEMQHLVGALV